MKQMLRAVLLFFVLLGGAPAFAQSAVWKISHGDNVMYLAGSWHLLRPTDYPLPKEFDMAFERAEAVAFETNLDMLNLKAMTYMQHFYLPPGKTLKTELRPDVYERLARESAAIGARLEDFQQFKPAWAIMFLEVKLLENLGFVKPGVDFHYYALAKKAGKRRLFMESVETQLTIFDDIDPNEIAEASMGEFDQYTRLNEYVDEWKLGKLEGTEELVEQTRLKSPAFYNRLFTKRNHAWLPRLERFLKTKRTEFVIVGFGHLIGKDGLLHLLRGKGYKVEQLK
ncbi:MAG: TraB/GumN family protein [Azoarcus sp.]|nr:TraB/GumN family protein [Azoarcus sp.]